MGQRVRHQRAAAQCQEVPVMPADRPSIAAPSVTSVAL